MSRKLNFGNVQPKAVEQPISTIGAMRFKVTTLDEEIEIDFSSVTGTRLVRNVVTSFQDVLSRLRVTNGQVRRTQKDLILFFGYIESRYPETVTPYMLRAEMLDSWVMSVMPKGPVWGGYDTCMDVFTVLKNLPPDSLSMTVVQRLSYVHPMGAPVRKLKNSYSPAVIAQIVKACRARIPTITHRLTVQAEALISAGCDPRGGDAHVWAVAANRAWLADKIGPLGPEHLTVKLINRAHHLGLDVRISTVQAEIFPTMEDLVPFFLLFIIESGWPPAVVREMLINCRSSQTKHHVTLSSKKYRAGHKIVSERFRATGSSSPGGLVATLDVICERLRRIAGRTELWLAVHERTISVPKFRCAKKEAVYRFLAEIDLRDDAGKPIRTLNLVGLRKSHKERWYKQTAGQIDRFARNDHSHAVAVNHYADIPALRELHEVTIAEGQSAAYEAVMSSAVSTASHPAQIAAELEIFLEESEEISSGKKDMWVSACRDPLASPFETPGTLCNSRPGNCFSCKNAVVIDRHLPRIYAYRAWIVGERENMSELEWNARHGMAYLQIERNILPKFSKAALENAEHSFELHPGKALLPPSIILRGQL